MPKLLVTVGGPAIPVVKPEWREQTLIFRYNSGRIRAVDCWMYGCLAVHGSLPEETNVPPVVITHAPTKLAIIRLEEVEDALRATERLWDLCRPAFVTPDKTVDKTKITSEAERWIRQCNLEKRCV